MAKLKTGRHTSALKAQRQAVRRTARNRRLMKQIRGIAKQVEAAISGKKPEEARKLLSDCFSAWDKAAKVGLIHKNAAARKKARLSSRLRQLASAA